MRTPREVPRLRAELWEQPESGNWSWRVIAKDLEDIEGDAVRHHTVKTSGFAASGEEAEEAARENLERAKDRIEIERENRRAKANRRVIT